MNDIILYNIHINTIQVRSTHFDNFINENILLFHIIFTPLNKPLMYDMFLGKHHL